MKITDISESIIGLINELSLAEVYDQMIIPFDWHKELLRHDRCNGKLGRGFA